MQLFSLEPTHVLNTIGIIAIDPQQLRGSSWSWSQSEDVFAEIQQQKPLLAIIGRQQHCLSFYQPCNSICLKSNFCRHHDFLFILDRKNMDLQPKKYSF